MNTRLAAIQDALEDAIKAQSPGCPVSVGYPNGGFTHRQYIVVKGDAAVNIAWELSGYAQRDEITTLEAFCATEQLGDSYQVVRDLTIALVGKVEAALANDRTLGGTVTSCAVSSIRFDESVAEGRRGCGATLTIVSEGASA